MDDYRNGAAARVHRGLEDIRNGRMVILVDDEDRENEGDLVMAAEKVTPEAINFMAKWGRGLVCLTLTDERVRQLDLPMMVDENVPSGRWCQTQYGAYSRSSWLDSQAYEAKA
jgi:3,4-dihydroxy 2-butanone 4-phosphate synthase/GTP cyclohydrolase II